ncbi:MAG TPA: hypothetical protein VF765_27765 [Polyangiaceae bacterium]
MTKVILGVTLAIMVGAGPAVAWDMTTQMPRRPAAAAAAHAGSSPWKRAGRDLKDAFKAVARVYLPHTNRARPVQQARLAPAPTASSIASAVPLAPPPPIPTLELDLVE